jgi:hypothetical protein
VRLTRDIVGDFFVAVSAELQWEMMGFLTEIRTGDGLKDRCPSDRNILRKC